MSRFMDVEAPMTAKCIIRDAVKLWAGDRKAPELAAQIVGELRSWGYEITQTKTPTPKGNARRFR